MSVYLYVDNSNIWIEGMRISAVYNGMAVDIYDAMDNNILDRSWHCDFGKLLSLTGGDKSNIASARLYGSRPPQADSLWKAAERQGFDVIVYDRNFSNHEKKIDTQIVVDMLNDAFTKMKAGDEIMLVSGDSDYVPMIKQLKDMNKGYIVNVACWEHSTSPELKSTCDNFMPLNPHLKTLSTI